MTQPVTGVPVATSANRQGPRPPTAQNYQTHPLAARVPAQGEWSTGLFDCAFDVPNCCLTLWCPCVTFGQNAEIIDRGSSSCWVTGSLYALLAVATCLSSQWIYSFTYRSKIKHQYGILPADSCDDCCIHCCCQPCALCQEYRELQHRGFDVPLGWNGNFKRLSQAMGVANPPVVPGGMTR